MKICSFGEASNIFLPSYLNSLFKLQKNPPNSGFFCRVDDYCLTLVAVVTTALVTAATAGTTTVVVYSSSTS
jgi:hypothetical protein